MVIDIISDITDNSNLDFKMNKFTINHIFKLLNDKLICIWDNYPITRF